MVRICLKVSASSRGISSSSSFSPLTRSSSRTAYAIALCMRTPSTSSFRKPIGSMSSLSNWLIGRPMPLVSTGVRLSRVASPKITPHGCIEICLGNRSSRSVMSTSRFICRSLSTDWASAASSGLVPSAFLKVRALKRHMFLAMSSIWSSSKPRASPESRIAPRPR